MSDTDRTPDPPRSRSGSAGQLLALFVAVILGTGAIFAGAALGAFDDDETDEPALPVPSTVDENGDGTGTADSVAPIDVPGVAGRTGGTVLAGVPGWPTCLNPILAACAESDELHWTVAEQIFPKLMELDARGEYVASPLLVERPTVANGGITEDPFTVTYRLDPDARWSDGTPITSSDVEFTWDAILATDDAFDRERYEGIVVDASLPDEVVIEFSEPRHDWPELFGGARGYVLQAAGFLNPDLGEELEDFVAFSGGPWILESWTPKEAVLVANSTYWDLDRIPRLDRVVFTPLGSRPAGRSAVLDGDHAVAYWPEAGPVRPDDTADDVEIVVGRSDVYEALWFNQRGPLVDRRVREALELIVPRSLILRDVVQPEFPEIPLLQCVGWVPTLGSWCLEGDYATFRFDLEGAAALLDEAGYARAPESDGVRLGPDGAPLTLDLLVDGAAPFATEIAQQIRDIARFAQVELQVEALEDGELEDRLRARDYDVALAPQVARADPGVTDLFACDAIPTPDNRQTGGNFIGWCNPGADATMVALDAEPSRSRQVPLVRDIGDFLETDHVGLPLFQRPTLTVWRSDRLAGPIGEFASSPYSSYWNMFEWEGVDVDANAPERSG